MKLERVKRWQWILVSLVVGFIIAQVRIRYGVDVAGLSSMNSQQQFEQSLIREVKAAGQTVGVPCFRNIAVYPNPAKTDKDRIYYLVTGGYYSGQPEPGKDGLGIARFRPYFYVEISPVYKPTIRLEQFNKPGGPDFAKKFKAIPKPTILDFLAIMKEAKGTQYSYAWWTEPRKALAVWMCSSFLVIGLIWPFVVSLLAYGTLFPPREEKGTDLSKVKSTAAPTLKPTGPTQEDMDEVKRYEASLQAQLKQSDSGPAPAQPAVAPAAPLKALTATHLEVTDYDQHKEEKAYGAAADDFYPTERKGHPQSKPDEHHP